MDDTLFIYEWFKKAMKSVGKPITDPKCSDIKKTYQYRAVSKFVNKALEYDMDRNQMQVLVKEIAKYAKSHKLLHRGTAILNMQNIFSICGDRLEMSIEATNATIELIRSSVHLIEDDMHVAEDIGSYPKLVNLFNSGELPIELLALSRRCVSAMYKISQCDRQILPSDVDLLKIRIKLLMDEDIRTQIEEILGDDLITTGVPS